MAKKQTEVNTIENESGEVAAPEQSTAVQVFKPKLVRVITLPLFKWVPNAIKYLKIDGEMFVGKEIKEASGTKKKEPATLMNVTDLETGEKGQVIVPTVLRSILNEEFPNGAYVGKCFALKQRKIPGKDYNGFDVAEIEAETAA